MEYDNTIILCDEEDNDIVFEFLDLIEYESNEYVVLLPVEENQSGEVVILLIEDIDSENESYSSIDDETTLQNIFNIFKEKRKDNFNFVG